MIRLTTEINGDHIVVEGTADEVVAELETLKKGLNAGCVSASESAAEKPKSRKKTGASEASTAPKGEPEPETDAPAEEKEEPETDSPAVKEITIADLRKAIQSASREQKQAAKQYLIDALGKADLPSLPEDKYPELMELVS